MGAADTEIAESAELQEYASPLKDHAHNILSAVSGLITRYRIILIRILLPTVYGLLFGSKGFEMGIYPFGISAVCASPGGAPAFFAAAGAGVSSLFVKGGFYIMAVCFIGATFFAVIRKIKKNSDGAVLRAGTSLVLGAAQTIAFTASDGIGFYDICGTLLSSVLCPVITLALRGLVMSEKGDSGKESGIYLLLYTTVYAVHTLSYTGESVATVIAMLATLYATYAFGIHRGVMTGAAVGLASFSPYSAVYAAAAITSGMIMGLSPIGAVFAGVTVAIAFGIHSGGAASFGELFPEFVFCAAIAGPVFHYGLLPAYRDRITQNEKNTQDINEHRLECTRARFRALADSLGAAGSVMRRVSKVFSRPSVGEMRQMCDDAFDESCQMCTSRSICWDKEYRITASAVGRMASQLHRGHGISTSDMPEPLRERCSASDAIIMRINLGAASAIRTSVPFDRTSVTADDYISMARLIDEVATEEEHETEMDTDASSALSGRLSSMGLRTAEGAVYGHRRRIVYIRGLEHGCPYTGEELRGAAESVLKGILTAPEYRISGKNVSLEMHTAENFSADIGRCSVSKKGEQCGDCITSFKGSGGYYYTLISDGMGSGGEAALTSGTSAIFLERMLGAGCSLTTAAQMLNTFLTRRNSECFTTIDLLEADLITGELKFLKSGAAPSFVLRGGKLFRLQSRTVPVGIVNSFDAETLSFSARGGDYVIMLSDGVIPDGGNGEWLCDMLTSETALLSEENGLTKMAEKIAKTASERNSFGDDVTVGIVKIREV